MKVYILRGIPGSGKTTWAAKFKAAWPEEPDLVRVLSADDYHTNPATGAYEFKIENLGKAHRYCLQRYTNAMFSSDRHLKALVVDNTNIRAWEIAPYYALAEAYGHDVEIVNFDKGGWTWDRNVHGVPMAKVHDMYRAQITEHLPPHWKVRHITRDEEV